MKRYLYLIVTALIIVVVFFVSWLMGCGSQLSSSQNPPATGISSVSPADNAKNVQIDAAIKVTFANSMDAATINANTFTLASTAGQIVGTISFDAATKTATFKPGSLDFSTTYTATLTTAIRDIDDKAVLTSNYSWSFTSADKILSGVGTPDAAFNGTGIVVDSSDTNVFNTYFGNSICLDAGKLLVAGYGRDPQHGTISRIVWRYNEDGSPDSSGFGTNGKVVETNGEMNSVIALQGSKILLLYIDQNYSTILTRLNDNGANDSSFGSGGTAVQNNVNGISMLQDNSGNIILAGNSQNYTGMSVKSSSVKASLVTKTWGDLKLWQYDANGNNVKNFAASGIESDGGLHSIALDKDGNILAIGIHFEPGNDPNLQKVSKLAVVRYLPDGSLDPNFGTNGRVVFDDGLPEQSDGYGIVADANGVIYAVGGIQRLYKDAGGLLQADAANSGTLICKYNSKGELDKTFNNQGYLTITAPYSDGTNSLLLDNSGKLLVKSIDKIIRLNTDGSTDNGFSVDLSADKGSEQYDFLVDSRGRVVVTGRSDIQLTVGGILTLYKSRMTIWRYK